MARRDGMVHFVPPGQEDLQRFISSAANQSVRPYNTNEEYLYAMKEDLAEWFKELYQVNIHVDNFIQFLQDGILLCQHANRVNEQANEFRETHRGDPMLKKIILPSKSVQFNPGRHASTFFARDNVANFINWCRKELLIAEAVMFESNDLILRKNEKNFILCLLEVARRGSKFGVPAPVLIQMEEDIDEEIEQDLRDEQSTDDDRQEESEEEVPREPPKQKVACDFKSLDEMVQYILGMCTCPTQFPMVKVSEGKYRVGDSKTLIFMRILRNHVMVRVGGGWDTLEHYLDKHDPCRCNRHKVEQKIAARSSRSSQGITLKQANDVLNKAAPGRNSETSRSREDWSNIKSQTLPGFTRELSAPSSGRTPRSKIHDSELGRSSKSTSRKPELARQNNLLNSVELDSTFLEEPPPAEPVGRQRSHSPAPSRGSKALSRFSTTTKAPEIRVSSTAGDPLNQTHPIGSRNSTAKSSNLRSSKTLSVPSENKVSPRSSTMRSKTPTPGSLRSSSTGSMSHYHEPRRSVTPTPTVTSQRRAEMNRVKSSDPDRMLRTSTENKRPSKTKAPPSSYRGSETLPRNHRPLEKAANRSTTPRNSSADKYNSLPRPSSAMSNRGGTTEIDSGRRSALSGSSSMAHHRSLQDVRQPPRPKSALGTYSSSSNLSTVPKTSGRKTIANSSTGNEAMQRLTTKARSQSMDNLSIQKQFNSSLSTPNQRNQFFDRLSQPKSTPKNRARSNLVDEDVLVVQRKGEGRHSVQRNSTQRPGSPVANSYSRSRERGNFVREASTSSEASSHSAQPSITPSDLRLRLKRDDPDKKTFRGQNSMALSTPSPSKDSALASSLRLSVSMTGSPDSPTSKVSYGWTPDSGGDDLESPSAGHPMHTPKIINRQKQESHLKAPPKKKVSNEEVIHVVRNPEGHHQWEHTDKSLEQSQEYIELSPYKEQLSPRSSQMSPRSSQDDRPSRSSVRHVSSSSDSTVLSPGGHNSQDTRVSTAQITLGKPTRSSTPNRLNVAAELQVSNTRRRNGVGSTSSSSVASSKSSVDGNHKKRNIADEVRSMLFTDSRANPANSSIQASQTLPRQRPSSNHRPTTPKNEISSRMSTPRSQPRPSTPRSVMRSTTPKPRPKTPDSRRSTLTRQEKLKSYDGPKKLESPAKPQDKETRMLEEFEREYSENQKILAASGDSEDARSLNDSVDHRPSVEYDYNGRRVRKKPVRSKSPSNLRSKSAPRMDGLPSCDSELTNRSYDRADSMADSEDFEVAMAMSGGAKRSGPSTTRSRSVDDFLDERGPKPRKDKHDSRKSRIPTPVHFNSGRKSATGVPYHDSNMSKSALQSNVEGVGTYEINSIHRRKGQGSFDSTGGDRAHDLHRREKSKDAEDVRNRQLPDHRTWREKENIQPSQIDTRVTQAEEYDLDSQECFRFGRYGNTKNKPSRSSGGGNPSRGSELKTQNDFVDGRQPFFHREDVTAGYVENQYIYKGRMQDLNSNSNNNNSNTTGQQIEQSEEPIPPPRKKGGYHRSNLHSSPADMLKPTKYADRVDPHENSPGVSGRLEPGKSLMGSARGQEQVYLQHHPHDRTDSGIEAGTDPDSPVSSSATSMMSSVNGEATYGAKPGSSGLVSSPTASQSRHLRQQSPRVSAHDIAKSHVAGQQQHGVIETAGGTYFYVRPGQHNTRLHTGYDAPRQNQPQAYQSSQAVTGYPTKPSKHQPQQYPKPAFYQDQNQYNHTGSKPSGYQPPNLQTGHQGYGTRLDSNSSYPPLSPSSAYSSAPGSRRTSSNADDSRSRHQVQHSPIYEHEQPKETQSQTQQPLESPRTRISKRRNFNDFFTDNRKLKDSLNNLNMLYSKDSSGNAFQLEDSERSKVNSSEPREPRANASTLSYEDPANSRPSKTLFPYASGGALPQYATPTTENSQGYYSSAFPRASQKDTNNNAKAYQHMDMGQYPEEDSTPAPPPRYKSQQRAYERQKVDNADLKYYPRSGPNQKQPKGFQFANGHDLRQADKKGREEYV